MVLFHSKEYRREQQTKLNVRTLQTTGTISRDTDVELSFDPKAELLVITHEKQRVTLPYSSIHDVTMTTESECLENRATQVADLASTIGFGKIAMAGKIAKKLIPTTTSYVTKIEISYTSQSGQDAVIGFTRTMEFEHGIHIGMGEDFDADELGAVLRKSLIGTDNSDDRDLAANEFEAVLRNIIARNKGQTGTSL